jgi:hypothetical protein
MGNAFRGVRQALAALETTDDGAERGHAIQAGPRPVIDAGCPASPGPEAGARGGAVDDPAAVSGTNWQTESPSQGDSVCHAVSLRAGALGERWVEDNVMHARSRLPELVFGGRVMLGGDSSQWWVHASTGPDTGNAVLMRIKSGIRGLAAMLRPLKGNPYGPYVMGLSSADDEVGIQHLDSLLLGKMCSWRIEPGFLASAAAGSTERWMAISPNGQVFALFSARGANDAAPPMINIMVARPGESRAAVLRRHVYSGAEGFSPDHWLTGEFMAVSDAGHLVYRQTPRTMPAAEAGYYEVVHVPVDGEPTVSRISWDKCPVAVSPDARTVVFTAAGDPRDGEPSGRLSGLPPAGFWITRFPFEEQIALPPRTRDVSFMQDGSAIVLLVDDETQPVPGTLRVHCYMVDHRRWLADMQQCMPARREAARRGALAVEEANRWRAIATSARRPRAGLLDEAQRHADRAQNEARGLAAQSEHELSRAAAALNLAGCYPVVQCIELQTDLIETAGTIPHAFSISHDSQEGLTIRQFAANSVPSDAQILLGEVSVRVSTCRITQAALRTLSESFVRDQQMLNAAVAARAAVPETAEAAPETELAVVAEPARPQTGTATPGQAAGQVVEQPPRLVDMSALEPTTDELAGRMAAAAGPTTIGRVSELVFDRDSAERHTLRLPIVTSSTQLLHLVARLADMPPATAAAALRSSNPDGENLVSQAARLMRQHPVSGEIAVEAGLRLAAYLSRQGHLDAQQVVDLLLPTDRSRGAFASMALASHWERPVAESFVIALRNVVEAERRLGEQIIARLKVSQTDRDHPRIRMQSRANFYEQVGRGEGRTAAATQALHDCGLIPPGALARRAARLPRAELHADKYPRQHTREEVTRFVDELMTVTDTQERAERDRVAWLEHGNANRGLYLARAEARHRKQGTPRLASAVTGLGLSLAAHGQAAYARRQALIVEAEVARDRERERARVSTAVQTTAVQTVAGGKLVAGLLGMYAASGSSSGEAARARSAAADSAEHSGTATRAAAPRPSPASSSAPSHPLSHSSPHSSVTSAARLPPAAQGGGARDQDAALLALLDGAPPCESHELPTPRLASGARGTGRSALRNAPLQSD